MSGRHFFRGLKRLLTHWHPRSAFGVYLHNGLFRCVGLLTTNLPWQWLLVRWGRPRGRIERDNFLLLGTARAGTTLAVDYLNCHPRVRCHGEVLGEGAHWYGNPWRKGYERLLLHVEALFVKRSGVTVGAKILTFHLDELPIKMPDLVDLLHRPKVVLLYRENLLEQYVSLKIAERDCLWHLKRSVRPAPIRLDPSAFVSYAERERRMWQENLAELSKCATHLLCYEHLVAEPAASMAEVFSFLGLPPCPVESYLVKINDQPLAEKVLNYEDFLEPEMREYTSLRLSAKQEKSAA